jgi:HicB family
MIRALFARANVALVIGPEWRYMVARRNREVGAMAKDAGIVKLNLRLSKGLHRHLVAQAKRNNTSLNTEIINILERDRTVPPVKIDDVIKATAAATAGAVIQKFESGIHNIQSVPPPKDTEDK